MPNKRRSKKTKIYPVKKIKTLTKTIVGLFVAIFTMTVLLVSVKGMPGNPTPEEFSKIQWKDQGPFELSPERGRYVLLYSLIENHSYYFSVPLARFVTPDLGYINGHYVSLFAPAVSYIAMPGYLIGRYLGAAQVGAFATSAVFAFLNGLLIYLIVRKLGYKKLAALLGALTFLFATPSFAYSTTLYEHEISTFVILLALYLLNWDNFWSLAAVWFLCAISIPIDYPNLFLMIPIGIFALGRIVNSRKEYLKTIFTIKPIRILTFATVLLPLAFFLFFNLKSYGNPLQFSGTIPGASAIDAAGNPTKPKTTDFQNVPQTLETNPDQHKKSAINFFNSRNMLNGIYIHIISSDRGVIRYTPVIILGLFGAFILLKKNASLTVVMFGIIGFDIVLYSMWGDPWGGWAFGSRYLIPAYSILAILVGALLSKLNRKWWFLLIFLLTLTYSIGVNTLGALTTSAIPPQAESLALEKLSGRRERYSFDRNWEFLTTIGSKSFAYNTWFKKYLTPVQYFYSITGSIALVSTMLTIALYFAKNEEENI